jgi:hypothetical protein
MGRKGWGSFSFASYKYELCILFTVLLSAGGEKGEGIKQRGPREMGGAPNLEKGGKVRYFSHTREKIVIARIQRNKRKLHTEYSSGSSLEYSHLQGDRGPCH